MQDLPTSTRSPRLAHPARAGSPTRSFTAALLTALACVGCASSDPHKEDVEWLVYHQRFDEAVRVAARDVEQNPDDPAAVALHRQATIAWYLEQGRRATFEDQDAEAIELFHKAVEIDPHSEEAADWLRKTQRKVALLELQDALEFHANDQIPEAVDAYERALAADPAVPGAKEGRELAILLLRYRAGLGTRYFKDGLHAYSDYWLEFARSRFSYAEKYQHEDERASDRKNQVQELLAIQRLAAGRVHEDNGRYGAARGEYHMALLLDPENPDAKEALERARTEQSVMEKLKLARIEIVRGRPEKAQQLAEEALVATRSQKDFAEGVLAELRESRFETTYRDALSLERDYRYEDAAARYDELLAEAQFYKDAIARRDTLREYVSSAADLYAKAEQAATPEEKLAALRQIELFWPEYRDVPKQIRALEKPAGS
jgi:hypothetical protein